MLSPEEHKERHKELARSLDQLVADFIDHTGKLPSETTLLAFMAWASNQAIEPTEVRR